MTQEINIGDLYQIIIEDYIETGLTYIDDFGKTKQCLGPIELYSYNQNEEIDIPVYGWQNHSEEYLEQGSSLIILDIIESTFHKISKLCNKKIERDKRVDVVFLLNNKKYAYDLNFFLKIAKKVELNNDQSAN